MNQQLRKLFPVTRNHIYLNHAAVCPISQPVSDRMREYTTDLLEHGLVHYREWGEAVERVRELAARLVNASSDEIAFAPNTSTGLAMIANGIDWREGDNIVTSDCEFPSNYIPWQRIGREYGVGLRAVPERNGRVELEELLGMIDDRTRVVTISFVEFGSGFRNDLRTIGRYCRERDILFVVDAIQGLGALRLDVEDCCIDAFAADAHKFLLGPDGIALLYIRRAALDRIAPTVLGWMSVEQPFLFTRAAKPLVAGARRFEPGALNTAGIVGLGAAIELFLDTGPERIEQYLFDLSDYLCARLEERGYDIFSSRREGEKSAFVCVRHPNYPNHLDDLDSAAVGGAAKGYSAEDLYHLLNREGIITTPRLGRLRISPHFYNTREEIDRLIEILPQ